MVHHWTELDEWRTAIREMDEVERATNCGHTLCRHAVCPDCGDEP